MSNKSSEIARNRPFLKWAGGKYRLTDSINKLLPKKSCLIEPFVGAGAVFLNSDYERYILADLNQDLINLFNTVKTQLDKYLQESEALFAHPNANSADFYYRKRALFNQSTDSFERSVLFLYLNRFGYNGLCRYNQKNQFNVPFGSYVRPYFPEKELNFFSLKSQKAHFICQGFDETFKLVANETAVYCDPPYAPLEQSSNFTNYSANGFNLKQQEKLAQLAREISKEKQTSVLISNHNTHFTRKIYEGAKLKKFQVNRSISQIGNQRGKANELFALFQHK